MPPKLSVFKNAFSVDPLAEATVEDVIRQISSHKYRAHTEALRSLTEAEAASEYKCRNFVGVTWSGLFSPTRKASNLQAHSGLICIDLDKLSESRLNTLNQQLQADEHTHVLFVSPSGNGLKVIIRVDLQTPSDHLPFFRQISDYYRDCYHVTKAELDASGKNLDRLCFLPYAPNAYYNPSSEVMPLDEAYCIPVEPEQQPINQVREQFASQEPLEDLTHRQVIECVARLQSVGVDLTDQYETWVEIGLAFASLGDEGRIYFHQVSSQSSKYDYQQCEAKFNELLKNRTGRVNIGTFFHHCEQAIGKPQKTANRKQTLSGLNRVDSQEGIEWLDPLPITTTIRPVIPLTVDMLPVSLRPWLCDIAERMKCPLDFVAASSVVMLSSLIGTRLTIKPKHRDDWTVVPNLWGAVVGDPSAMKTPSVTEVLKPLNRLVAGARQECEQLMHQYEVEAIQCEIQKKVFQAQEVDRLKGKAVTDPVAFPDPPAKPVERRYMTNDATIEKLADLLNENPTGLLQYRDELIGLFAGWDRPGREPDRAFYLEAWTGSGEATIDRIGRGTTHVKNVCLSLLGGIQPSKLLGYLQAATGYENDGFVQRLQLAVYPDKAAWSYGDDYPDKAARDRAFTLIQAIAEADFKNIGYDADEYNKFAYTRFDADAQEIFRQWLIDWETNVLQTETGLLLEHLTKYRSLMPSLALIFHVVNCYDVQTDSSTSDKTLVSFKAATMAVRWCEYLMSHARRIYGLLDTMHTVAAKELLRHIKAGDLKDGFKAREVQQKGWSSLRTADAVELALVELVNCHWLRDLQPDNPSGAGRPEAPRFRIHPELLQKA